jgi:hypothetical protein
MMAGMKYDKDTGTYTLASQRVIVAKGGILGLGAQDAELYAGHDGTCGCPPYDGDYNPHHRRAPRDRRGDDSSVDEMGRGMSARCGTPGAENSECCWHIVQSGDADFVCCWCGDTRVDYKPGLHGPYQPVEIS